MGHSAEEKIKILYEDSLADIRDLTGRMETMTAAVMAAAEKVNNEKSILHGQIVGLENNMSAAIINQTHTLLQPVLASIEAAARRHLVQNTFPIIVVAVASFVAGFGSHNLPAVGSVSVGMIVGFLASQVSFLFQKNDDDRRKLESPPSKAAAAAFVWTETDFQRAASQTKLSKRTLRACRDVLIEYGTIGTASVRHGVLPPQIHRGLSILRQAESRARL